MTPCQGYETRDDYEEGRADDVLMREDFEHPDPRDEQ